MRVAALQLNVVWENRSANFEKVSRFADQAKADGADILILPEMFSTGFSLNPRVTAEPDDGPTAAFLSALARRLGIYILGGVTLEATLEKARNCALIFDRAGKEIVRYTKMKLFSFSGEDQHHLPGTAPVVFDLEGMSASCFICYDLRFPLLFQEVSDQCDVIFVIASWPAPRQHHFEILIQARAVENQLYVVGVNRTGEGGGVMHFGGSQIISPTGDCLAHAGDDETLIVANIDSAVVQRTRKAMPFLLDR